MEIRNLYEAFELDLLEVSEYDTRQHKNTFFEMVFILEGDGIQVINNRKLPCSSNKLFLLVERVFLLSRFRTMIFRISRNKS